MNEIVIHFKLLRNICVPNKNDKSRTEMGAVCDFVRTVRNKMSHTSPMMQLQVQIDGKDRNEFVRDSLVKLSNYVSLIVVGGDKELSRKRSKEILDYIDMKIELMTADTEKKLAALSFAAQSMDERIKELEGGQANTSEELQELYAAFRDSNNRFSDSIQSYEKLRQQFTSLEENLLRRLGKLEELVESVVESKRR